MFRVIIIVIIVVIIAKSGRTPVFQPQETSKYQIFGIYLSYLFFYRMFDKSKSKSNLWVEFCHFKYTTEIIN